MAEDGWREQSLRQGRRKGGTQTREETKNIGERTRNRWYDELGRRNRKEERRIILNEEVVCYNKSPILHQKYVNIINEVPQRT